MIGNELKVYDGLTPRQQLNLFRNLYYNDGNATEYGIIANAINDCFAADVAPKSEVENYIQIAEKQQSLATDRYFEIERLKEELETVKSEVTRCKDCIHYRNHPNGLCYAWTEPCDNERGYDGEVHCVEEDDFCSYAEPKKKYTETSSSDPKEAFVKMLVDNWKWGEEE